MGGGQSSSSGAGRPGRTRPDTSTKPRKKRTQDDNIAEHHEQAQLNAHKPPARVGKAQKAKGAKRLSATDVRAIKAAKSAKRPTKQQRELKLAADVRAASHRRSARQALAARRKANP